MLVYNPNPNHFLISLLNDPQPLTINLTSATNLAWSYLTSSHASRALCGPSPLISVSLQAGHLRRLISYLSLTWKLCQVHFQHFSSGLCLDAYCFYYFLFYFLLSRVDVFNRYFDTNVLDRLFQFPSFCMHCAVQRSSQQFMSHKISFRFASLLFSFLLPNPLSSTSNLHVKDISTPL